MQPYPVHTTVGVSPCGVREVLYRQLETLADWEAGVLTGAQ